MNQLEWPWKQRLWVSLWPAAISFSSYSTIEPGEHFSPPFFRACGGIFCNECSKNKAVMPNLGYVTPVRVCDACYRKSCSGSQSSADLNHFSEVHLHDLFWQEILNAYQEILNRYLTCIWQERFPVSLSLFFSFYFSLSSLSLSLPLLLLCVLDHAMILMPVLHTWM